jgi:hypothetical protein
VNCVMMADLEDSKRGAIHVQTRPLNNDAISRYGSQYGRNDRGRCRASPALKVDRGLLRNEPSDSVAEEYSGRVS